jgi:hypothetical protein
LPGEPPVVLALSMPDMVIVVVLRGVIVGLIRSMVGDGLAAKK